MVSKIGRIVKINEAGRKLIKVANLTIREIEDQLIDHLQQMISELSPNKAASISTKTTLLRSMNSQVHVITSLLPRSDYFLVEVRR